MSINNIDVSRNNSENSTSLLRRFSRKAKGLGFMRLLRKRRYFQREDSDLRKKRGALKRIETRDKYAKLRKMGKIS